MRQGVSYRCIENEILAENKAAFAQGNSLYVAVPKDGRCLQPGLRIIERSGQDFAPHFGHHITRAYIHVRLSSQPSAEWLSTALTEMVSTELAAGGRLREDAIHEPLTDGSVLPILADIIIVPFVRAAYSIGDVFIAIGGFLLPFVTLTRR